MNEEYLLQIFNNLGYKKEDFESFKKAMSSNKDYNEKIFNSLGYNKEEYDSFKNATGLNVVKKKEDTTESTLEDGGLVQPKVIENNVVEEKESEGFRLVANPEEENDFQQNNRNSLDSGISTVVKSVYDLPSLIYDTAALFTNPIARTLGIEEASSEKLAEAYNLRNIPSEILEKRIDEKNKKIQEYNEKNGGDALTALENGNVLGAAKMITGTTIQSIPIMIATYASGGTNAGLATVALSTASTKAADLKRSNPDMDVSSRTINALATGGLEATLGQLLTGASAAVTKKILMTEGSKKGAKIIADSFRGLAEEGVSKNPIVPLFGEILEESLVNAGEQLFDISTGIRDDFDIREVVNSGISSIGMGGVNTVAVYGAKGYVSAKEYIKLKEVNKKLSKLSDEVLNSNLSVEEKELLNQSIDRLRSDGQKIVDDAIQNVSLLPDELKIELDDTILKLDKISVSAFEINSNKDIPIDVKEVLLNELKSQAIELTSRKNEILSTETNLSEFQNLPDSEKIKIKEDASKILLKEAQDSGETDINISDNDITKKAIEIYNSKMKLPLNEQEITRKKQLEDAISEPENGEGTVTIGDTLIPRQEAVSELQQLNKKETDAIQSQISEEASQVNEPKTIIEEQVSSKTQVNIAPFFDTTIETIEQANELRKSPEYKQYKDNLIFISEELGIPSIVINDVIGGYKNNDGVEVVEISNQIVFDGATLDQAEEFAAIMAALAPEVQEATIAGKYTSEGDVNHNANEYNFKVEDINQAIKALKDAGITDFSINESENIVSFTDVLEFSDVNLEDKIGKFAESLGNNNVKYEKQQVRAVESRYIDKATRKEIIKRIEGDGVRFKSGRQSFRETIKRAVERDAEFQGTTIEEYTGRKSNGPSAGNRLFNEPLKAVIEIANGYYQRAFGTKRPDFKGTRKIDKERAKRISDAFDAMQHNPNDPETRKAYNAMAKETIDQYKAFIDAGYVVEINNNEPYANSQEMIDDLRDNKRIKIFSTESGFGDTPITEQQRKENPLLKNSDYTDTNGQPLLINDLFRAVHDFFGHAELGNSFGPIGEENAWNIHSRMYSPLARRAMTTETRGQNSYVNFSGINDKTNELRKKARELRSEGKYSEASKLTDEIYENTSFADQKIGLLPEEFSNFEDVNTNESQGINEQDLPGYDRMMGEVEGIIEKSKKRRVKQAKIADNVMSYVMGSKVYERATDVQREALVRDIRKRFGLKEKKAPSVNRILGKIKDVKKFTITEKTALKKQIKDLARGARDAVRAQKLISQELTKDVKKLAKSGKITAKQAANVLRAFSKVNVFSEKSIDGFTNYMARVFENAEYAENIKKAKKDRSSIRKLSKNKDKNANLRALASEFINIDPSLVDDINEYNDMASKIKEAIKGSSVRASKVKFAETVNIENATDYINKIKKEQEQKLREEMIAEIQSLMDVDASDFSAEDMLAILGEEEVTPKGTKKYNNSIVRATVKRAFDVYSAMIKKSISSGKDVFTGEDVTYTPNQKDLIKKFMAMDTTKMDIKESVAAIDSLLNFLVNKSTAKMETVVREYTGRENASKIKKKGIFAVPLKKLGSSSFGRFLGEQTTTLNVLFEKMFVGFNRSRIVMEAMGLMDLINGKAKAQRQSNTITTDYVSKFYDKKANNQKFNTLFNNVERGMASFTMRNVIGTDVEMKAEFNRRKKLIEESIDVLSKGNEEEKSRSLVYKEVYDKILKDSNDIQTIKSKVDKTNLDAIDYWMNEWDNKFERLSDVSLNIYNKILDKDINFIPDKYKKTSYNGAVSDLSNNDSAFISNTNGRLYKKKTGVLMEATRPKKLPQNPKSKLAESYIDLSFDSNNSNSMYDALVDIETAGPIRQIDAFMNTPEFIEIFGADANLIKLDNGVGRIQQYIQNIRNKNPYSNDEFSKMMRGLNKISTLGVGQALAGPTQPLKQVLPVIANTIINNKGNIDFSSMSNTDFMSWLKNIGYGISNRGIESQADIESINKLIIEASDSKGEKLLRAIEKANKKYLDLFLVKPDVWIAVSSWKSYYEQSLKKQGIDPKGINYANHDLNKKAADYAQGMVDRQQNISDTDMAGTLFSNRNPFAQTMVKIFMPFASFRMNQSSRLGADLRTLKYWNVSTPEDKKIAARSIAGYAVEMAVFRSLSGAIAIGLSSLASSLMGRGDDEEEKKKRNNNLLKGVATSSLIDVVSPLPVLDKLVQNSAAYFLETVQSGLNISEEERVSIYKEKSQNFIESLGTFGISAKRADELWSVLSLSVTGEYKDRFGRTLTISEEDQEVLGKLFPVVLTSNLSGLASPEISSVVRNAVKISKKKKSTFDSQKEKIKLIEKKLLKDKVKGVTYDNKTELKRYNPKLYEKNFGKGSEWYQLTKDSREAKEIQAKEKREKKDKLYNYTKKDGFGSKKFGGKNSNKGFGSKKFGSD